MYVESKWLEIVANCVIKSFILDTGRISGSTTGRE